MPKTLTLAPVREFMDPDIRCFDEGDLSFVVIHKQGQFYALNNHCPHKAAELCQGTLNQHHLSCPWHKAAFDIRDGSSESPLAPNGVKSWPLEVVDEQLILILDTND